MESGAGSVTPRTGAPAAEWRRRWGRGRRGPPAGGSAASNPDRRRRIETSAQNVGSRGGEPAPLRTAAGARSPAGPLEEAPASGAGYALNGRGLQGLGNRG